MKCWKITNKPDGGAAIHVADDTFTMQDATADEISRGTLYLTEWSVEREYMVQVCGPDSPKAYFDRRSEPVDVPFEELIFSGEDCIGICHEECIFLFDDKNTHHQKKWLGEFITGPDRGVDVYDYYNLIRS